MLEVQRYLTSGRSLDDLSQEFGIRVKQHESLPLAILNYDQIKSPKTHPIVRECRALVLHSKTFKVVAKAFHRFFNCGEGKEAQEQFGFEDCITRAKEDGSLMLLYFFDGSWRVNTRGSFAQDYMPGQKFTWTELFCNALGVESLDTLGKILNRNLTYVFELVSLYNKVVREYRTPKAYLLTCFDVSGDELTEIEDDIVTNIARECNFERPNKYEFRDIDEVKGFLERMESEDPTFEGFVLRDKNGIRLKIKNKRYLTLHHMRGNGDTLYSPKNLLPWVLADEGEELLTYFPETKEAYAAVKKIVDPEYTTLEHLWEIARLKKEQKDFAIAVVPHTRFSGLLFALRKEKGDKGTIDDLKTLWKNAESLILKVLFP